jgi:hypothetical protein
MSFWVEFKPICRSAAILRDEQNQGVVWDEACQIGYSQSEPKLITRFSLFQIHFGGAEMFNKFAIGAALVCLAVTPGLAQDAVKNWADVSKDLKDLAKDYKDLRADYKDLKNDKLQFQNAVANGSTAAASNFAADIAADKRDILADRRDIHADRKDLRADGVKLPTGKR